MYGDNLSKQGLTAFLGFSKTILEFLRKEGLVKDVGETAKLKWVFPDDGGYGWSVTKKKDFYGFASSYLSQIAQLNDIKPFIKILFDEKSIIPIQLWDSAGIEINNPTYEQMYPGYVMNLNQVVMGYILKNNTFTYNEEILKDNFEKIFKAGFKTEYVQINLLGYESDIDFVKLSDDICIKRLSAEDKTNMANFCFILNTPGLSLDDISATKFTIEAKKQYGKKSIVSHSELINTATNVLTALRLLQTGTVVGGGALIGNSINEGFIEYNGISSIVDFYQLKFGFPPINSYKLEGDKIEGLINIFNNLQIISNEKASSDLDLAIRRYNQSYSRSNPEDRIIDLTIALESTLLHTEQTELKHRLGLRGALLLNAKRNPKKTYDLLSSIYDVRSTIVHDGKHFGQKDVVKNVRRTGLDLESFLTETEQVVREVLVEYLNGLANNRSMSEICKYLETEIINNLSNDLC